ncbi:MAG: hypothetical protein IJS82_05970 [Paludibacteraceae bacterium]|nr:hypothetical protein [Paludibacteraceae bacterium]
MADVELSNGIDHLHGKLASRDDIYYRTRNGKQFAVQMVNPRQKFSPKEKTLHAGFGQIAKLTSRIAKDPALAAPYMPDFEAQKANGGQTSLYQYLLTRFLREAKSDRAAKIAELTKLTELTAHQDESKA